MKFTGMFVAALVCSVSQAAEPDPAQTPGRIQSLSIEHRIPDSKLDNVKRNDGATGDFKDGVLILSGPVDRAMRERFNEAVVRGDVTAIRITSQGGDAVEGLRIAATVLSRGIGVVVHRMCVGACAQYIFVAGKTRQIEKGALVGFMASIKATGDILQVTTEMLEVSNSLVGTFQAFGTVEENLYRRRGVSVSLLQDTSTAMQPKCVILKREGGGMNWNTSTNYVLWVPTREYLKSMGVEFEGEWPSSRFQMWRIAGRLLKTDYLNFIRFGSEDHLQRGRKKPWSAEQLKNCVADVLPKPDEAQ